MTRFLFIVLLALALPLAAHEGGDHEDLREGAAHHEEEHQAEVRREIEAEGRTYLVVFHQEPSNPRAGEEIEAHFELAEKLDPPDPLLGDAIPLADAQVTGHLEGPEERTLEPHAEAAASGTYGVHLALARPGDYTLHFEVQPAGGAPFAFQQVVEVARSPERQAVAVGGWIILAFLAVGTVLGLARGELGSRSGLVTLGIAWLLGLPLVLIGWRWADGPVPVEPTAAESMSATGVVIPAQVREALGLRLEPVRLLTVRDALTAPGRVEPAAAAAHELHAPWPARVLEVPVAQVGQPVQSGQTLVVLEELLGTSDELAAAAQQIEHAARQRESERWEVSRRQRRAELEARLHSARADLERARAELERAESLFAIGGIAAKELEAARFGHRQAELSVQGLEGELSATPARPAAPLPGHGPLTARRLTLTAPITGVVTDLDVTPGEVVHPEQMLYRLVDLSHVWVKARVHESDLARVRRAQHARVRAESSSRAYEADLVTLGQRIDPASRTVDVVFQVANPARELLEGMSVEVEIEGATRKALLVPESAVVETGGEYRVFVPAEGEAFEPVSVTVGETVDQGTVIEGLKEGDLVVSEGAAQLLSEFLRRGGGG